jgi:hypothetical protein
MAASPITTRLPDWLDDELKNHFAQSRERRSEGFRRVVEEWWAMEHFPLIEFRDGVSGRRASVRGGPDVWEIMMVARDYADNPAGLREHFGYLDQEQFDQALAYAERFSEQIQEWIEENDRVGRSLQAEFEPTSW